jgi:hypothetical protein
VQQVQLVQLVFRVQLELQAPQVQQDFKELQDQLEQQELPVRQDQLVRQARLALLVQQVLKDKA